MSAGIRQLIQKQVAKDAPLAGMLARYGKEPAFFYQKSPHDSRPGWGKVRYPRADFNVDIGGTPRERRGSRTQPERSAKESGQPCTTG